MKNPFKTVLDAIFREEPTNNKEIEEAAEDAKTAKKEQNTKGGEGR